MLSDVAALDKVFDYVVPSGAERYVTVGTRVRIELNGRRVGGWVLQDPSPRPAGRRLRPLAKVTGWGPPAEVVELTGWAAWRWAGRRAGLLRTASAPVAVPVLPGPVGSGPSVPPPGGEVGAMAATCLSGPSGVLRLPPAADPLPVLLAAAGRGPVLVLFPSSADAAVGARRLRGEGVAVALLPKDWARARVGGVTVVGSRAAAWAPLPDLAAVVVVDGHDEAYQEGRAPTWHARDVAVERARRAGVPCVVVSPCPDLVMAALGQPVLPSRGAERSGWPLVEIVDRRNEDPRSGLFSGRLTDLLRRHNRVVCVLNRKGRAGLLACAPCGELARCEKCQAAMAEATDAGGGLCCRRCRATRPLVCAACGAGRLKALRKGVGRARQELEALAGRAVAEVTGESNTLPETPLLVGTEAVLHRAATADAVVFLDFDQELLAPRYRAAEQALALLARAGRLVGGRKEGGRVMVQTRLPRHEVLDAALHGDPGRLAAAEVNRRAALGFPPFSALAALSGPAAPALVERLAGVEVLGPDDGHWLVRAPDSTALADALATAGRPPGRLRIEVDPLRV